MSGPHTLEDFYSTLDSFVAGTTAVLWKALVPYLCGPDLRGVATHGEQAVIAERCWELLCEPYFASGVLSFYNADGRRGEQDELALRLTRNARGLFASAMAASAARAGGDGVQEAFKWSARAVRELDPYATAPACGAAPRVEEPSAPEGILATAFGALAVSNSSAAASAHAWSLHWLNPQASEQQKRRWTWIAWVSNGTSGYGTVEVADTGLKYSALVEHAEGALVPVESDWLDSAARAWNLSRLAHEGCTVAWRARIPPPWLPLAHQSAGAALFVAMSCLRSGRPCDRSRAVLAGLPGGEDDRLQAVRSVERKIDALPKEVRAVAVAEGQTVAREQINVEVVPCASLEGAVEFASDLVTKVRSFLLRVSDEGAAVGRGVGGGPHLEPFLSAAGKAGAGHQTDPIEPDATVRRPDRSDVLPARVLIRELASGPARRAVVLGEGGFGKTQLAWWAARGVADIAISSLELKESGAVPPQVPLPLDACDLASALDALPTRHGGSSGSLSFDDRTARRVLEQAAAARHEAHADLLRYLADSSSDDRAGVHLFVIIDNLDRVAAGLRERVFAILRRLASWPCSMLLTCREYAFDPSALPGFDVYRIKGLTLGRARRYVAAALADDPERASAISRLLGSDRSFGLLARSPLLLTMICGVARQLAEFKPTRTALYHNYLLDQLGLRVDSLGAQLRLELLKSVGLDWFEAVGPAGEVEGERLVGWLGGGKVLAYPLTVAPERADDYSAGALTLKLLSDLVTLGIFAPTGPDGRSYRAGHPSIIEFLAGTRLSTSIEEGNTPLLRKLADAVPDAKWRDIIPFVAGSLKNPAPLLAVMLRPGDPFHLWLFAVAECLAEVSLPGALEGDAEQVARRLVDLLESPSRIDRDRAVEALGRMGLSWGGLIGRLLGPLLHARDPDTRAAAVEAACAVSTPEHIRFAARYVQERGARRRADVLRRLAAVAPVSAAEAAQALHSDFDMDVRWAAAEALASVDGDGYRRLVTQLKVGDGWSRRIACRALLLSEAPDVAEEIKPLIEDATASVRAAAVEALAWLKTPLEPGEWAALTVDENPEVRLEITRLPGIGAEQLRPMLRDNNERVVLGAIESLWRSGSGEASDFRQLLNHPVASVRMKAAAACHALGVSGCLDRLVGSVEEDKDAAPFALTALGSLRESAAVDALLRILPAARPALRLRIVNALGRIGDKRATQTLLQLLDSADPAVQAAATSALGRIGDPQAYEAVSALVLADTAMVRRAAVSALTMLRDPRSAGPLLECMRIPDARLIPEAATALRSSVALSGLLTALDTRGGAITFAFSCPMPWLVYELIYSYVSPGTPGAWSQRFDEFAALTAAIHTEMRQEVI